MVQLSLMIAAAAFLISVPVTWRMISLGRRLGQVDRPDAQQGGRKAHGRVVPNTGGVAIFLAMALPLTAGLLAMWWVPAETVWPGWLAAIGEHQQGIRQQTPAAMAVLAGLAVLHVMGLYDDRRALGPYVKLAMQLMVTGMLVIFFDMRVLEMLGAKFGVVGTAASVVITVVWMVAIINAMNMLDNMDGVSGGIAAIIAAMYLAATLINGQWFVAVLAALLLGAVLGFLLFNFPPAKIFMGDGGSMVLGLAIAVLSVRTTYFRFDSPAYGQWWAVLMPVMILAVPLYDLVSVTLIRLSQGRSPFVGDRNHFSHRLARRGLGARGTVLVIWLCTFATGLSGVMFGRLAGWQAILAATQTLAIIAVLAILDGVKREK